MHREDVHTIDSIEKLRAVVGEPGAGVELKVYDRMVPEAVEHIARSPFRVLSTADAHGRLDASPLNPTGKIDRVGLKRLAEQDLHPHRAGRAPG